MQLSATGSGYCQSNRLVTDVLSWEEKGWTALTLKCRPAGRRSKTERKEVMTKAWAAAVRVENLETMRWNISPHLAGSEMDREDGEAGAGGGQLAWWCRLSEDLMLKAKALAPSPSPGPDSVSVENQLSLLSLDFFTCEMGLGAVS